MQKIMNQKNNINKDTLEIDLGRIWKAIWKRIWLVGVSAVLCAVIFVITTFYFVTPKYESSAMFYVNNNSLSVGDASFSISQADITASKSLVDTYIVILKSRSCLNDVIDYAGVDLTYTDLSKMISASSVDETEVFEIVVTSDDPKEAENLANAIAYILPKRISSIVEGTAANVVDNAIVATKPSSPNYINTTVVGFIIGMAASILVIILREVFDVTIRASEDIERCCEYPLLASVPDMISNTQQNGQYYG